ncbi:MAG TPA: DUF3800 domain-containing protein [Chloroflexota bacterium]|nr:DUF3800 domain-containing protein [Chloroflexota bacterium]
MLVFVDESGDLGYKFDRGSSAFFTIALVVFTDGETARQCQEAIEQLRDQLGLPPRGEFHFSTDSHKRRLALLQTAAPHPFTCHTFTLNKTSPMLTSSGLKTRDLGYAWVCRVALENLLEQMTLLNARVVLDGSGEREFRKQLQVSLQRQLNAEGRKTVRAIRLSRSDSDPLLQLADYVAGVTNRLYTGKGGADEYERYLAPKRGGMRLWP